MKVVSVVLLSLALVAGAHAFCYDAAVARDRYFDDSFICNDNIPYPGQYIEQDVLSCDTDPSTINYASFLATATSCFNETNYFTQSYASTGDYSYQCVCPSPRKRIDKVFVNKQICFVVQPERQDIQYAQCNAHCSFNYGTPITTASRGYFCVNQNFVKREFLVWCPKYDLNGPVTGYGKVATSPNFPLGYNYYGRFHRVSYTLPTLCSCRGYFCDDHAGR